MTYYSGRKAKAEAAWARVSELWKPVMASIAAKHGATVSELLALNRTAHLVLARQEFAHTAFHDLGMSLIGIGRALQRDRATVRFGIYRHAERLGK
jgi:chromosomal replication initiation ATPase DnaA